MTPLGSTARSEGEGGARTYSRRVLKAGEASAEAQGRGSRVAMSAGVRRADMGGGVSFEAGTAVMACAFSAGWEGWQQ